jgi:tetratricopeptide (TPR) repeat protein
MKKLLLLLALLTACATPGPPTVPNDREWNLLTADYQWLQTLRDAQPKPSAAKTRREQIETSLSNLKKLETTYNAFFGKLEEYYKRTSDPRAAAVFAREKILLGDEYMLVLARYDRAIEHYNLALQFEPANAAAQARIAEAQRRRFVVTSTFANLKAGMKEEDVRRIVGLPREDWIKQVVQNGRIYSVWIYPKTDGGAAAVYFDNGVVYHTNWNAAAPPAQAK